MPDDGGYAWEKLYEAVLILARGSGPLDERLRDAYRPALASLKPDHHFPWPDLRERFINLMEELAPEGRVEVATATWPDHDLRRIAQELVGLYDRVTRHQIPL